MAFTKSAIALAALAVASACGDASTGEKTIPIEEGASATGTVYGESLAPVSWRAGTSSGYSFNRSAWSSEHTVVKISDVERSCGEADFPDVASTTTNNLLLDLFDDPTQPDSRVTEPGTFEVSAIEGPISSSRRAIATFVHNTDVPVVGVNFFGTAKSGKVTVEAVSADGISGTFDLLFFDDGDRLTGSFGALFCKAPFPPVSIDTPGDRPELGPIEINVQFVGASPVEVVVEAEGPRIIMAYFEQIERGLWQLDDSFPTGDYQATVTAKDERGDAICRMSLAFAVSKDEPTKIDTVVTCAGSSR